jgi:uncharacterized damage-inducible protein DinB
VCDTEGQRLARYSTAVRESSLKRLRLVPEGSENWRVAPGAMTFGDLAQHLIDADKWLFRKLEDGSLEPIVGQAGVVNIMERTEYLRLLDELAHTGEARASLLASMTESELEERIIDTRFDGETTVWWTIVRGNLDHETHHRGEIGAYLSVLQSGK